jgi:hypothetical protein
MGKGADVIPSLQRAGERGAPVDIWAHWAREALVDALSCALSHVGAKEA